MFESIKNYFSNKVNLAKYEVIKAIVDVFSAIFSRLIILALGFLALIFSSISLAFYLSETYSKAIGFGVVSLGYLILIIFILLFKRFLFNCFLKDFLTQIIFKKSQKDS